MDNYIEYTVKSTENKMVIIITDIHNCHLDWYDMPTAERMELMCDALKKEYEIKPYDCILALGGAAISTEYNKID